MLTWYSMPLLVLSQVARHVVGARLFNPKISRGTPEYLPHFLFRKSLVLVVCVVLLSHWNMEGAYKRIWSIFIFCLHYFGMAYLKAHEHLSASHWIISYIVDTELSHLCNEWNVAMTSRVLNNIGKVQDRSRPNTDLCKY